MKYFDAFTVGDSQQLGARVLTRDDIVRFAGEFDRLPFHLDDEAAKRSPYRGLIASGLHTLSLCASIVVDEYLADTSMCGGQGMNNVRWVKPVRPGDSVAVNVKVIRTQLHPSMPGVGVVTAALTATNQDGSVVMSGEVDYLFTRNQKTT